MRLLVNHLPSLSIALICLAIAIIGDAANLVMRYDRSAIESLELWRILTGNLAHLSWNHLWMNLAGLLMISFIFERQLSHGKWLINFLVCSLTVSISLYLFNPELHWYVGLSGTLHGLLLTGIMINVLNKQRLDLLLLAVIIGKLAWEQLVGAMPGSEETAGGPVIVDAHLYGAIAGLVVGIIYFQLNKLKR